MSMFVFARGLVYLYVQHLFFLILKNQLTLTLMCSWPLLVVFMCVLH